MSKVRVLCVVMLGGPVWVVMVTSEDSVMSMDVEGLVLLSVGVFGKVLK